MKKIAKRKIVIISIQLLIAVIHIFKMGSLLHGSARNLYYSYFSDLVLPFGFYFLLCASESKYPLLRRWGNKAFIVFSAAVIAEICQYFGIYALGSTFDPVDFIMYAAGVLLTAGIDAQGFSRLFRFWKIDYERA